MNRSVRLFVAVIVLALLCALFSGGALLILTGGNPLDEIRTVLLRLQISGRQADLDRATGSSDVAVRFSVNPGDTPPIIAQALADRGLILDPVLFVDYVRAEGIDRRIEAGVYFLNQTQSLRQIAGALTDSGSSQIPFRILEGWRAEEIAAAIDSNPFFGFGGQAFLDVVRAGAQAPPEFAAFAGVPAGASLEGFLFPNTYQLPPALTPELLRDYLLTEWQNQVGPSGREAAAAQGLTLFDIARLASIVQREAVRVDEMPMIASVYRNRLAVGMKLDADPTVQYALGFRDGSWWPRITQADYSGVISPYNTYLNLGLPPGAIANPGLAAIQAAIYPAQSPYYYFRAACDGSGYHTFAISFEEHLTNAC